MIENADLDERQRLLQPPCDELVGRRDLSDTARVGVCQDQGRRVPGERLAHHLARVDRGAVDRAAEELDELDEPMAVVEKEDAEGFELLGAELHREERAHRLG